MSKVAIQTGSHVWYYKPNTNDRVLAVYQSMFRRGNMLMARVTRVEDGKMVAVPMSVLRAVAIPPMS